MSWSLGNPILRRSSTWNPLFPLRWVSQCGNYRFERFLIYTWTPNAYSPETRMVGLYDNWEQIREDIKPEITLLNEKKIVVSSASNMNVHPHPLSSFQFTEKRSTIHLVNVIRAHKRCHIEQKQIVTSNMTDQSVVHKKLVAWLLIIAFHRSRQTARRTVSNF